MLRLTCGFGGEGNNKCIQVLAVVTDDRLLIEAGVSRLWQGAVDGVLRSLQAVYLH